MSLKGAVNMQTLKIKGKNSQFLDCLLNCCKWRVLDNFLSGLNLIFTVLTAFALLGCKSNLSQLCRLKKKKQRKQPALLMVEEPSDHHWFASPALIAELHNYDSYGLMHVRPTLSSSVVGNHLIASERQFKPLSFD